MPYQYTSKITNICYLIAMAIKIMVIPGQLFNIKYLFIQKTKELKLN